MRRILVTTQVAAGLVLAAPTPTHAATSVYGYVWANQPSTSSYLANTGNEFNSTGGDIEVVRWETGRYRVRFAGMGSSGGVANVGAYGATSNICTVARGSLAYLWADKPTAAGPYQPFQTSAYDSPGYPARSSGPEPQLHRVPQRTLRPLPRSAR
jgi:hypothetical protein